MVLKVRHLSTYMMGKNREKIAVVNNVSFSLSSGKTLALVGESGSGKSMTALSLLRILPQPPMLHPEGEVLFHGKNLLTMSEREMRSIRGKSIAMIFQDPMSALNPVYTVGDQLEEVVRLHLGLYGEEAEARILRSLEEVGIPSAEQRLGEYPHQLSGGMKQRVMIAMALLCEPEVLIADEPTTALDVTIQAQVLDLIRNLQRKKQMSVLLITHDMGVVAEMADEVMVMYATQVVEKGDVYRLFDHMAHPYTQGLFHSRPHQQDRGKKLQAIEGSIPSLQNLPKGCPFHNRCSHVMDCCREGKVPWIDFAEEKGHGTRCWLYAKEKQKVTHG